MIKIEYVQKAYRFDTIDEGQPYTIETKVTLNDDISTTEAIIAFLKIMNIATHNATLQALKDTVQFLEEEGYENRDRIM